jgi:SAM-dependent methyltransferase
MTNVAPAAVRARAFDAWADEYERFRPGYPDALFDLITDRLGLPEAPAVVDLGAGTGKVSRAIARRGWRVTAVDPGEGMLAVLRARADAEGLAIEAVRATAERTGLPAASFDAAVAGEAYHWFDAPAALAEMGRIVRPGGGIAFFWNVVDQDRSSLVASERSLVDEYGVSGAEVRKPGRNPETRDAIATAGAFEEPDFVQVPHVVPMTGAEYEGLAFTKSHLRTAPAELQERYRSAFRAMLASHGIAPDDRIDVPYVVDCWIARRIDQ